MTGPNQWIEKGGEVIAALFYDITFMISLLLSTVYMVIWHRHFNVNITMIFVLIPVTQLGNMLLVNSKSMEAAMTSQLITYIGGCYLMMFVTFSVLGLCKIELPKVVKWLMITITTSMYICILTTEKTKFFYKNTVFKVQNGSGFLYKNYGTGHTLYYAMIIIYLSISFAAMVFSFFKKKDVSRKTLYLLILPAAGSVFSFFGGKLIGADINLSSGVFVIAQATYLVIVHRMCLYNISETSIDSLVQNGDTGLVSFDFKFNYLGSNETAKRIMPELRELTVDKTITRNQRISGTALKWMVDFKEDAKKNRVHYEVNDKIYLVNVGFLYDGIHLKGYQLFITDDTQNQRYIALMDSYNTDLKRQVEEKTANIVQMHDKFIMGMATMVESRDNSTGGHIKRTSVGVKLLIDEILRQGKLALSEDFCRDIIKAAPMHDLGKIAVDDAILRKPGRFTDAEFEIMKTHAAEGAKIVSRILEGTEDTHFKTIAENVAHYHHERWDGSGYPDGLKGEEIPLEARIMAIADVYDALVSKRVYKEKMSFEDANNIIMEGMGKHFDSLLEPYYVAARPKLEEYYSSLGAE